MPTVLVTDHTFGTLDIERRIIEPLGCKLDARQCKKPEQLLEAVAGADYVLTQFARLDAPVIAAMARAKVIVRYGVGVDNVDLEAARAKGIPVCNVPDYCIDEVADHTLALLLATTRQIVPNHLKVLKGEWGLAVPLAVMKGLYELTVGVVGFGRIGREVVSRLRPFKAKILVSDPAASAESVREAGAELVSLDKLLAQCDVVTLHCPSTSATRGLISQETVLSMKPGATLINVSRGDLVDSDAITAAADFGHLGPIALDVFDPEPFPVKHPLLDRDNVVISSHVASTSVKAVTRLRETAARIIAQAIRGEQLPNVVNGC